MANTPSLASTLPRLIFSKACFFVSPVIGPASVGRCSPKGNLFLQRPSASITSRAAAAPENCC
jgi:hypothetical protein